MLEFNKEKLIDETCMNFDSACDIIFALTEILNFYIEEDLFSDLNGGGCFGKDGEDTVREKINVCGFEEYFEK